MNDLIGNLIEALREELKQYGEMLALMDHQQQLVMHRRTNELLESVTTINAQSDIIQAARRERGQRHRHLNQRLNLKDDAGLGELIPLFPPDYRPLVLALVQENNELLVRVQQRARQNHLLLSRAVDLMQRFINTLTPTPPPTTYNDIGRMAGDGIHSSLFQAVG
ncbi:MAG TPA: flagellar export chaperone FlgN [Verrucomicrobiae bacterium]|nr:flagellar export chaperone FlgN [Verrucomicrobiae bacterium]